AAAPPRAPTARSTRAPTPAEAPLADAVRRTVNPPAPCRSSAPGRGTAARRRRVAEAIRRSPRTCAAQLRTPPFPPAVTCGTMLATPTGTALTGDTPRAAIRRSGARPHAHPPHPLGRHRNGRRRSRGALLGPPAGRRHRRPDPRRRAEERPGARRPARSRGRGVPARLRPGEGRREAEGVRGPGR